MHFTYAVVQGLLSLDWLHLRTYMPCSRFPSVTSEVHKAPSGAWHAVSHRCLLIMGTCAKQLQALRSRQALAYIKHAFLQQACAS